ncbi:MAG: hypothetical protein IT448_07345 [Phycisphaerales bacterium]|nr:hypothetical protein [Phycisphaerales bacterium]
MNHSTTYLPTTARQHRRGNILILVIVLLVLLALAGTAFLSVARNDRVSTTINSQNTQVDLLMDSLQELVKQKLIDDLPIMQRQRGVAEASIENWTHFGKDKWLADRLPIWYATSPTTGFPVWRYVSDIMPGTDYVFMAPATGATVSADREDYLFRPGAVGDSPALQRYERATGNAFGDPLPAADADGDGIADAPYFMISPGRLGDLTYYAGIRIVDNTAAINVNTALDRDFDWTFANPAVEKPNYGFFTGNTGLMQLMTDFNDANGIAPEIGTVNDYRYGFGSGSGSYFPLQTNQPIADQDVKNAAPAATRTDLFYDSQAEALWTMLGRRVDNPGFVEVNSRFRGYPISEMMGLAYRFTLKNEGSDDLQTLLERSTWGMPASLPAAPPAVPTSPLVPSAAGTWYSGLFDFGYTYLQSAPTGIVSANPNNLPLRSLLVTHNPVGNLAPLRAIAGSPTTGFLPQSIFDLAVFDFNSGTNPSGTDNQSNNLDPITLVERTPPGLDLRFSSYLKNGTATPLPIARTSVNTAYFGQLWRAFWMLMYDPTTSGAPTGADTRMFRREQTDAIVANRLSANGMIQLRAALAAVNTEDLRDYDDNIRQHTLEIEGKKITVFGTEKQVFITEVITHIPATGTGNNYLAIELYCPYLHTQGDAPISMENWQLAAYNRSTGALTPIHSFTGTDQVNARAAGSPFLVIQSAEADRPADVTLTGVPIEETRLRDNLLNEVVLNGQPLELVLLRPRMATGTLINPAVGDINEDPVTNLDDFIPVDQVNLTGLEAAPVAVPPALPQDRRYYYARIATAATTADPDAWKCVYPGPSQLDPIPATRGLTMDDANAGTTTGLPAGTLGAANATATYSLTLTVPLNDYQWPGYRPLTPPAPGSAVSFPYGGFAREGDLLTIPFIGAYTIRDTTGTAILALNSVTLDASYADEDIPTTGVQLGRFIPFSTTSPTAAPAAGYEWTSHLFEFLTANQNPGSDFLPNANPVLYVSPDGNSGPVPQSVPNGPVSTVSQANNYREQLAGINGLININTAPPQVLDMLPLTQSIWPNPVPTAINRQDQEKANRDLAYAIWKAQENAPTTPFKTAFDLLKLPEVRAMGAGADPAAADYDQRNGDTSPILSSITPAGDGTLDDFEQHYLPLTRLSNLITTRSDSFTVYLVLEGWRDGTRVIQRRAAFIVDRSGYTPLDPQLHITNIPTQ